jgi:hypothetical protein
MPCVPKDSKIPHNLSEEACDTAIRARSINIGLCAFAFEIFHLKNVAAVGPSLYSCSSGVLFTATACRGCASTRLRSTMSHGVMRSSDVYKLFSQAIYPLVFPRHPCSRAATYVRSLLLSIHGVNISALSMRGYTTTTSPISLVDSVKRRYHQQLWSILTVSGAHLDHHGSANTD